MGGHRNCDPNPWPKLPLDSRPTYKPAIAVFPHICPTLPHGSTTELGLLLLRESSKTSCHLPLPATLLNPGLSLESHGYKVSPSSPAHLQAQGHFSRGLRGGEMQVYLSQPRVLALSQRSAGVGGTAPGSLCPGQESPPPSPGQPRMETPELPRTCFWSRAS